MRRLLAAAPLFALAPAFSSLPASSQKRDDVAKLSLKAGDVAPDFTLLSDQWKTVMLSDSHGKKNVFLAVYVLPFAAG